MIFGFAPDDDGIYIGRRLLQVFKRELGARVDFKISIVTLENSQARFADRISNKNFKHAISSLPEDLAWGEPLGFGRS